MIPHIGQSGETRDIDADRRKMTLRSGGAQAGHAQIYDIRFDLAQLLIAKTDAIDDIDAVIVEHDIGFRHEIVKHALSLRVFEIDGEGPFIAVKLEESR